MGFNPTFYAGRPKLSEVTIDSDLNMGGRNILRVGRIDSPYRPDLWPTEELDWGDVPASDPIPFSETPSSYALPSTTLTTFKTFEVPPGDSYTWRFKIVPTDWRATAEFKVTADGVELHHIPSYSSYNGETLTFDILIPAGSTVEIQGRNLDHVYPYSVNMRDSSVQNLGIVGGPKTFNLSGKWLALGIDMKGLAATVKIHGVEMPYEEYIKYFPIAPTELKIPGGWDASQIRPIVEVYV